MHSRRHVIRPHNRFRYPFPNRHSARTRAAQPVRSSISLTDRVEELRLLCRELSVAVANVEKWMNAGYNVSRAIRDKKTFSELVSAISALETQDTQEELKEIPEIKLHEQPSDSNDELVEALRILINKLASGK